MRNGDEPGGAAKQASDPIPHSALHIPHSDTAEHRRLAEEREGRARWQTVWSLLSSTSRRVAW